MPAKRGTVVKSTGELRLGFVPLLDAAPLIAARELGYFADEGLHVTLHRQIGWANMRDKLAFRQLDAGHALLGMPLVSHFPDLAQGEPLVSILSLGAGGNAITISNALLAAGVRTIADLAVCVRRHRGEARLVFGHVFGASMHHYLLRDYLASGGIDPDKDVRLAVIPPAQMPQHMLERHIDGFCVGEPWNTIAQRQNAGRPLLATTEILPNHPEKVLAVTRGFLDAQPDVVVKLLRAVLRACQFAANPAGRGQLAALLARPEYIDQPAEILLECLATQRTFAGGRTGVRVYSFETPHTFPGKSHGVWLLKQMQRWKHLAADAPIDEITEASFDTAPYRKAAATLNIACPPTDYPAIPAPRAAALAGK